MTTDVGEPIYVARGFLDAAACDGVRRAMDEGAAADAAVLGRTSGEIDVQAGTRRALEIDVAPAVLASVEARLDEQLATLAAFFGEPLTAREGSGFVRYGPGAFYAPHQDWSDGGAWPEAARRRVAIVLFLNGARDVEPDGGFDGGRLRIYPDGAGMPPIDLAPRTGTLVAFRATAWHEVTVVTRGVRDVVVDWAG